MRARRPPDPGRHGSSPRPPGLEGAWIRTLAWSALLSVTIGAFLSAWPGSVLGQETDVEQALETLDSPWYEDGEVVPLPLDARASSSARHRSSQWLAEPPKPPAPNPGTAAGGGPGGTGQGSGATLLGTIVTVLVYVLIAAVVLAIVGLIVWLVMKQVVRRGDDVLLDVKGDVALDPERIEHLPFDVARPQGDLLALARTARDRGDLKMAVVYLFGYMLLKLDKHHWIELTKGKTNRQYLREVRRRKDLSAMLERTTVAFEDVFFGDLPLETQEFDACWQQLDRFHQVVEGTA